MLRHLLALFPIDAADADRATAEIATTPLLAGACWAATLVTSVALIGAAAFSVTL